VTHSKRDANEPAILDGLRALGIWYRQMDRCAGFDLLIAFRGVLHIIEVKAPAQPPSKRRLTANEERTRADLLAHGVPYHVALTLDDVLRAIGALT
jgi:hypothetical protein